MKREIYEVHMAYVNKDGYHASDPSGYPKIVDSSTAEYGNDTEKALKKPMVIWERQKARLAHRIIRLATAI